MALWLKKSKVSLGPAQNAQHLQHCQILASVGKMFTSCKGILVAYSASLLLCVPRFFASVYLICDRLSVIIYDMSREEHAKVLPDFTPNPILHLRRWERVGL
jgi:hypothetical protein